jgi:hypothetical protein
VFNLLLYKTWAPAVIIAFFGLSHDAIGQGLLAALVALIGFILNRRTKQIQVNVDGRLGKALQELDDQQKAFSLALTRISALETALHIGPGQDVPA